MSNAKQDDRCLYTRRHALTITKDGQLDVTSIRQDRSGESMRAPEGSRLSRPHERPIAVDGVLPLLRHQGFSGVLHAQMLSRRRPRVPVFPVSTCTPEERALVDFVGSTSIGLIRFDRRTMTAAAVIARLAIAAPAAKIVVHVASRGQSRDLELGLGNLSVRSAARGSREAETAQVVYGTFAQLALIPLRRNQPRIDVALDWKVALHARQHDQWLLDSDIARLFVLSALGDRFSPGENDELRLLAGFDEFRVTAAGRLAVDIGWAVIAHRQRWTAGSEFRDLYWRNALRNDHIAGAARVFAFGTHDRGEELGPAAASFLSVHPNAPRVAVVVAQPEHGRELAVRLRVPCETGPGEPPLPPTRRSRSRPELRVVTSNRLLNLAVGEIDILIWAAGCRAVPSFADAWWSTRGDQPHRILWLDLSDEGRRDLASWARQRIEGLRRWGGHPAGWDAAVDRCMCWLESRYEGGRR